MNNPETAQQAAHRNYKAIQYEIALLQATLAKEFEESQNPVKGKSWGYSGTFRHVVSVLAELNGTEESGDTVRNGDGHFDGCRARDLDRIAQAMAEQWCGLQ